MLPDTDILTKFDIVEFLEAGSGDATRVGIIVVCSHGSIIIGIQSTGLQSMLPAIIVIKLDEHSFYAIRLLKTNDS